MRYIAFLRAINVGGHTVKMERLRALFEEVGVSKVETFIASGNVIFESRSARASTLERTIERHLHSALGWEVATFVRTAPELATVAGFDPFPAEKIDTPDHALYVAFLQLPPSDEIRARVASLRSAADDFAFGDREIYWLYRRQHGESAFTRTPLEKLLRTPMTVRNVTTVRKLAVRYPAL